MLRGRNNPPSRPGYGARMVADALAARDGETNRLRAGAHDWLADRGFSPMSANYLSSALDFVPGVGDVSGAEDTYQAAKGGDYGTAAIMGGATLLGMMQLMC